MAAIQCQNRTLCCTENNEDPLANFSMEASDPNRFLNGQVKIFQPPLGTQWGAQSCSGWCWSSVSAEDAYLCALNAQQSCVVDPPTPNPNPDPNNPLPPGGGPNGNPGWQNPDGHTTELFPNQAQTCNGVCPDNTPYSYTVPAGSIYELTTAEANYRAYGLACRLAAAQSLCFNSTSPLTAGCPGEDYLFQLSATGGSAPLAFTIIGGSLPPGLALSITGTISGVIDVSAIGDYTFTVKLTDENGITRQKNFVVGVCGPTNSSTLTAYEVGTPYSVFISGVSSVGCGTGAQSFTLIGTLPPGLSLDPNTGEISGTPTGAASGDYTFSVRITTIS